MATIKNYTLDLSDLASQGSANKLEANKNVAIKLGSETVVSVNTGSDGANQVSLANFGTVRTTDGEFVDFVADAGIAAGQYGVSLASATPAKLNSFDASKATNDLKVSIAATSLGGAKKVATGSGKDTIYLDTGLVAFGGANADTFVVDSTDASTISDYNYAQGDVVQYTDTFASSNLGWVNGEATIGGSGTETTIKAANNNGVFQVLLEDNTHTKTLAAKAAVDAAVEVTLDKIAGVVDVADAKSAVVDLGAGSDTVKGVDTTALTLKVGMNDGTNSVDTVLGADDTIRFSSGSWNAVEVDTASSGLKFGNTTLASVLSATAGNTFNVQFGDGEAQKVAYTTDTTGDSVAAYKKDINFYLGKDTAHSGISVNSANEEVNLNLITGAKNIVNVTVGAAKALNFVAAGDSSVSASAASHSGDYVFDLTASSATSHDTLSLAASNGKDIVKLSTTGGADSITGFDVDEDVLVLDDVSAITDKTFVVNSGSNDLYLKDLNGAKVGTALAAKKDVTVQLADGTTEKVAMMADSDTITATEDTSLVLNLNNTAKLSLTSKAAGQMFDMTNVVNDGVKFVGNSFEEVTIGTANGVAMFIGTKGVDKISVNAGTSENGAAVWAGKDNDATVSLSAGADIVWAGFLDGDVTVSSITKDDAVYTYGENLDAKAVAGRLSYNDTNNLVFASSDSTKMDLGAAAVTGTAFKVAGNAGSLYNVVGMDNTNKVSYSEDADILVGDDAMLNVMVEKTVGIDLSGTMGLDSKVYRGIKSINASQSTSNSCLVLANSAGGQITASAGGSAMWGGGNESQTLIGGYGADLFWFGSTDGADFARNVSKDDCVFLYNAADISEVEIGGTNNNQLIFTATGSTLTFGNGCVDVTQMTFSINDLENPGSLKNYSYNATSKTFVEKK